MDNGAGGGRHAPRTNALGRVAVASTRHPVAVLAAVLLLTAGLGYGATLIHTNVDVTDVLPRGDPNTDAAKNLTSRFKSAYTQQVSFVVRVDEQRCLEDNAKLPDRQTDVACGDITDEVYIRAMDEMEEFITSYPGSPFRHVIGAHSFYRLINWTVAGGQNATDGEAAFAIPGSDPAGEALYAADHELVWVAIADAITAPMDPSREVYTNLYLVEPKEDLGLKEIGEWAFVVRGAYLAAVNGGQTEWTVFGGANAPLFFVDIPVANAHSSLLVREDFANLLPFILAFFAVTLYLSFRNVRGILLAGGTLGIATVWVFGAMGWMDIALNTLNLTVVPLILGVGVDYSIHVITEVQEHQRSGHSPEEAMAIMGRRAAFALLLATVTTIAGLAVMVLSPSVLIGQVGLLSALAIAAILLLNITFLPAAIALSGSREMGATFRPSRVMEAVGAAVSRARWPALAAVLAVTVVAAASSQGLTIEAFGEPGKNFPADDPVRREHEEAIRDFYDLQPGQNERKTNVLVFQGDMADPAVHRYMDAVQEAMRLQAGLDLNTSRNLPFLVRTWLTVKDGVQSVGTTTVYDELGPLLGQLPAPPPEVPLGNATLVPADDYPQSREALHGELGLMFASPLATFGGLFVDAPDYTISVMTFATETGSYQIAEDSWNAVWTAVASVEGQRPPGVQVAFVGNTATNYLFIAEELPWVGLLSAVSLGMVVLLVAATTRDLRATLVVGGMSLLTSVWFVGLLPHLGIGLAITLVLPLVFISAIGSDYALHMVWNMRALNDPRRVYAVVGKSVMFSAITSVGAFLVFTNMQNVPMARTMLASAVAVMISFVLTVLVVPIAYPVPRPPPPPAAAPQRAARPPVVVREVPALPDPAAQPRPAARPRGASVRSLGGGPGSPASQEKA